MFTSTMTIVHMHSYYMISFGILLCYLLLISLIHWKSRYLAYYVFFLKFLKIICTIYIIIVIYYLMNRFYLDLHKLRAKISFCSNSTREYLTNKLGWIIVYVHYIYNNLQRSIVRFIGKGSVRWNSITIFCRFHN